MTGESDMTRTMRIDLIPDVPKEPVRDKRRIVVKASKTSELPSAGVSTPADSPYQELLDSIYDAVLITDLRGRIVNANVRAGEFFQFSKPDLQTLTLENVIAGADSALINTLCRNLENQRFTLIQAYGLRKDASFFPVEIAVNRLHRGPGTLCFFIRDITVRRQAEEMLRTEHQALQNAAAGIAITNLEGVIEYVNPAFAALVDNLHPEDLFNIRLQDLFDDEAVMAEIYQSVIVENRRWRDDLRIEMPSGRQVDLEILASSNRNSDGEAVGIIFSFVDLSDRKRAEEALRDAERHRVMLESLGAACHHLGQPATVLMANLGLIRAKVGGENPALSELIDESLVAVRRLGDTLHKLNCVNEYCTIPYIGNADTPTDGNRILKI